MSRPYCWTTLVIGAAILSIRPAFAEEPRPVKAVGTGEILAWDALKGYELRLQLRVRNLGKLPTTITRSEVLMVSHGGWSVSQGESIARDGKFLGGDLVLKPGSDDSYDWTGVELSHRPSFPPPPLRG